MSELILRFRRFLWRRLKRRGPPPGITIKDAESMFNLGMESVRLGQCQEALAIARELNSYRYTGAWELEAAALFEIGDADGAIEVLQSSIEKMPIWRNGHLLGIYLSDEGRYEEALKALHASLAMREPQPKMTEYNVAIILNRAGRPEEAIRILENLASCKEDADEPRAIDLAKKFLRELTDKPQIAQPRGTQRSIRPRRPG